MEGGGGSGRVGYRAWSRCRVPRPACLVGFAVLCRAARVVAGDPKSVPGWFGLVPKLCFLTCSRFRSWTLTCGVCSSCRAVVRASGGVPPLSRRRFQCFVPLRLFGGSPVRAWPTRPSLSRWPLTSLSAAAEMRHPLSLLRRSEWRVDAGPGRTNLRQCAPRDLTPCRPSQVGGGTRPRHVPRPGQPRRWGLFGSRHQA